MNHHATATHADANTRPVLVLRGIEKTYGTGKQAVTVVRDLTVSVASGEFYVIIGPSGAGKTTLLNIIAGFEPATSGDILLQGIPVTCAGRERAVIFQDTSSLFPWLTAEENVAFGLRMRGTPRAERTKVARSYLHLVGLGGDGHKFPHEMSGGMRQRVQIARALGNEPEILICDEPFASLDAQTREDLQIALLRIWEETGKTVLFVTHSIREAVLLADKVALLSGSQPAHIRKEWSIALPRPREMHDPDFVEWERRILADLRLEAELKRSRTSG